MLEVVVAPPEPGDIEFKDYPYFVDFDPKKREMYEQVTDTGEVMSRSLDDVNVRRGQTTLQSHEVRDEVSVGATAEVLGVGLSAVWNRRRRTSPSAGRKMFEQPMQRGRAARRCRTRHR
ncbi:hypothetical protein [Rhodococcus koreensis]|uniref:hypothetical protein n=1 Tax=Rhodococcus koreensis TaxID=99653 RepID=UPI000943544B|nr:hypothetical protein [Rhodococcus koreensis]